MALSSTTRMCQLNNESVSCFAESTRRPNRLHPPRHLSPHRHVTCPRRRRDAPAHSHSLLLPTTSPLTPMAALTSSAVAPLRVRAAAPTGRKVRTRAAPDAQRAVLRLYSGADACCCLYLKTAGCVCARVAAEGCRVGAPGARRRCRRAGAVHRRRPAGAGQLLRQHADGCVGRNDAVCLTQTYMC